MQRIESLQVAESKTDKSPAIIERGKKGDQKAFRELYDQYVRAMFGTSMRILNNEGDAEDVLQDSFLSAFRNLSSFEGRATFGSWLKRIVINNSIDVLKKRRIDFVSLDGVEDVSGSSEEDVKDPYHAACTVEDIQAGVRQLPDGYRTILTLFLFEDYTHKMIAEQLGISENTSKTQYLRARRKLAAMIHQNQSSHE